MKQSIILGGIVTLLIAFPVLGNDMVFVGLQAMRKDFSASSGEIQLAVSSFLLTVAVVQLAYGPLSDQYGRRPVILVTLGIFVIASVLCAIAASLNFLVAARVLQAIGAGAGPALGRAILRDQFGAERSVRMLSYVMACFGVIAVAAPMTGGILTELLGWRSIFGFAAAYGASCFILVLFLLKEPAPSRNHDTGAIKRVFRSFSMLLTSRNFVLLGLSNALIYSAMFAWLAGFAFVLIDSFGLNAAKAGLWFGVSVSGFVVGSALAGQLTNSLMPLQIVVIGAFMCLAASAIGSVLAIIGHIEIWSLIVSGLFMMMGIGLVVPPATGAGIAPFPEVAGAASSLIGFTQGSISSLSVLTVGYFYDGSTRPMLLQMAGLTAFGIVILLPLLKHRKSPVLLRS